MKRHPETEDELLLRIGVLAMAGRREELMRHVVAYRQGPDKSRLEFKGHKRREPQHAYPTKMSYFEAGQKLA